MICNKGKLGFRVETGNEQDTGNNIYGVLSNDNKSMSSKQDHTKTHIGSKHDDNIDIQL